MRVQIAAALHAAGVPARAEHGFTPHMTLGYNLGEVEPVASTRVKFGDVHVVVGHDRHAIPLGEKPQIKSGYDPAIEVGPHAGWRAPEPLGEVLEVKDGYTGLPGTYEARLCAIADAVRDSLRGDPNADGKFYWSYVNVDGTWENTVIATRCHWTDGGSDERESYEMPYTVADDGSVSVGEPSPVRLVTVPIPDAGEEDGEEYDDGDLGPLAGALGEAVKAAHVLLTPTGVQVKAGRVLSGLNANRLKDAVQTLVSVLSAAGISIDDLSQPNESGNTRDAARGGDSRFPDAAFEIPDTTSPGANSDLVNVKAADIDEVLAGFGVEVKVSPST
jgi:hypothetical protein